MILRYWAALAALKPSRNPVTRDLVKSLDGITHASFAGCSQSMPGRFVLCSGEVLVPIPTESLVGNADGLQ